MENSFNASMIKTKEDIKRVLDYTINESRIILQNAATSGKFNWGVQEISLVCVSILNNIGIKSDVAFLAKGTFEHCVAIAKFKLKDACNYYILDPTFEKFLIVKNQRYKYLRLKLEKTTRGKELIEQLINDRYFEYNETDMKLYGDAIVSAQELLTRDKEIKTSGEQYFEKLAKDVFLEWNTEFNSNKRR